MFSSSGLGHHSPHVFDEPGLLRRLTAVNPEPVHGGMMLALAEAHPNHKIDDLATLDVAAL